MQETITEIIRRLKLKYLKDQSTIVTVPIRFSQVIEQYNIPIELGLKFLILRNELEPRMNHCPELQFYYAVHTGLLNSQDIYGRAYYKKFQETDIEKIDRKILISSERYKKYGIGLTPTELYKDHNYSVWWKMQHVPVLEEFGFFDPKAFTILTEYSIGKDIQESFTNHMYPFTKGYWLLKKIKERKDNGTCK